MRNCPLCSKKMEKVSPAGTEGRVVLDRCTQGGGIWFDKGEIVEALSGLSRTPGEENIRILTGFLNETLTDIADG